MNDLNGRHLSLPLFQGNLNHRARNAGGRGEIMARQTCEKRNTSRRMSQPSKKSCAVSGIEERLDSHLGPSLASRLATTAYKAIAKNNLVPLKSGGEIRSSL
jgi:hypothetical protein